MLRSNNYQYFVLLIVKKKPCSMYVCIYLQDRRFSSLVTLVEDIPLKLVPLVKEKGNTVYSKFLVDQLLIAFYKEFYIKNNEF